MKEDCFANVNGECDCLLVTECDNCSFYKKRTEVNLIEILEIRRMSEIHNNRAKKWREKWIKKNAKL